MALVQSKTMNKCVHCNYSVLKRLSVNFSFVYNLHKQLSMSMYHFDLLYYQEGAFS